MDEISTMFNNGIRPVYALYSDSSQGVPRYVYRITFMGECYTPSADRYCYSVPEAQKSAAEYVLKQIGKFKQDFTVVEYVRFQDYHK